MDRRLRMREVADAVVMPGLRWRTSTSASCRARPVLLGGPSGHDTDTTVTRRAGCRVLRLAAFRGFGHPAGHDPAAGGARRQYRNWRTTCVPSVKLGAAAWSLPALALTACGGTTGTPSSGASSSGGRQLQPPDRLLRCPDRRRGQPRQNIKNGAELAIDQYNAKQPGLQGHAQGVRLPG